MAELRPPMLDDYGLLPALRWVGEQLVTRTGITVHVEQDPRQNRACHCGLRPLFSVSLKRR